MAEAGATPPPVAVEELLDRVLRTVRPLAVRPTPLLEALGLRSAEEVVSPVSLPAFDNSAMDGYAVLAADVATASAADPVRLPVAGEIGAGRGGVVSLAPGTAVKIMTGAPIPAGCDAVVPYEWTDRGAESVVVRQAPAVGAHLRRTGEDVETGDLLLAAGTLIGPRQVGLLAGVGRDAVAVRPRPRVVVISTGSELREPGAELGRDSIYDANSFLLAAAVREAGATAQRVGIVPDDADTFRGALADHLAGADLIVTSGGVSEGDYDVVKESLRALGTVWFGAVAMQPGKPQGFGTVGEAAVPIFTLPGNPVSSYVSFQVFVLPAIRRLRGLTPEVPPAGTGRLRTSVTSPAGRRQFLRAAYDVDARVPVPELSLVGGPGSHLLGDLAGANALVVVPEDVTALPAGAEVAMIRLDEPPMEADR